MPYLRLASRAPPTDIHEIASLLNFPCLEIAIVVEVLQSASQHPAKLAQFCCLAATFLAQKLDTNRKRPAMRGPIELQPARQILALQILPALPINQRVVIQAEEHTHIDIEAIEPTPGAQILQGFID